MERGRPRSFDRDAALDAAMRLFWCKGFTATSMSDLCGAMGIGSTSLYAAFGSKEALYAEALERYGAVRAPMIWRPIDTAETARGAIEGLLMASAAVLAPVDGPRGCMVALSAVGEEGCIPLGRIVAETRARGIGLISARLRRAVAEGELPSTTDLPAIARFYFTVQQGMSLQARDGASRADLETVARSAMAAWPALAGTDPSPAASPVAPARSR